MYGTDGANGSNDGFIFPCVTISRSSIGVKIIDELRYRVRRISLVNSRFFLVRLSSVRW